MSIKVNVKNLLGLAGKIEVCKDFYQDCVDDLKSGRGLTPMQKSNLEALLRCEVDSGITLA